MAKKITKKVTAQTAKKVLTKIVAGMTPKQCLKMMPKMMKMFGGNTPQMRRMMGKE